MKTEAENAASFEDAGYEPDVARAMAAQQHAIDVLMAAGFHSPETTGRDLTDPISLISPAGQAVDIAAVCDEF